MFEKSAHYYDLIYRKMKDYEKEARQLVELLEREHPAGKSLLDVACGTGEHDLYMKERYHIQGMDLNPGFIEIARQKNPECNYSCADMAGFDLGCRFDIVTCLFSSIGYVKTVENLEKSIACFARHLERDGILLLEPWFTPGAWKEGNVHMATAESDEVKVCRMNISETRGSLSCFTFHYLLGTKEGVVHFTETHELGLFTLEEMSGAFEHAGLKVQYDPAGLSGRGLYVARPC